ncbi:MAG: ParB N-terminal domain-containing protein [Candidatus Thiodiazotropha endolucinida]|nr:ParB N-terminal domain-containing protein [Candidatus Thiodiazotropha taylori]MCG8097365.1 ParB N-terminal domain-containing protein [Candidatus Thiodiazotropha endolucinida]MCG7890143.1 ParB N-terminal domain-containing protein [Candidatus Thiodiazotropha taylori]MCG7953565.1 ParB N-terminal domain-containing protein [Candidatus Thiodiazotropha taylori]MCW4263835.1 ParB N-terminal domain-containing protein [Candidatus Thiodiazotropha endolucinida]
MAGKTPTPLANSPVSQQAEAVASSAPQIIDITRIQPYERNPRHVRNPEYDRIKDSIRSAGLDQPLVVTQRPGATDYIVHSGGNTRLIILKELIDETGDQRYSAVPCLLRPWCCESDVLLAHLRENDLRGNLTFIDKARAVFEARRLLAEELGLDDMSQRRLETELRRAGYRITQARISQMEYAAYRLLPLIPLALEQGLGRPHVERIRRLERAAYAIWRDRCSEPRDDFEEIFVTLCRRYDGPDWDTDVLRGALESEIAGVLDVSIHTVRVMLDAELAGRELVIPEIEEELEEGSPEPDSDAECLSTVDSVTDDVYSGVSSADSAHIDEEPPGASDTPDSDDLLDLDPEKDNGGVNETPEPVDELPSIANDTDLHDLKSLRGRAWTLAARLAQRNGMSELVEPVSGKGLGFILRDVPDPTLADQLDQDSLSQLSMLWWQLAACAEMTYAPLESILPLLPAESILHRALETEDADLLFNSIWTLDPGHTGYRLWRPLDDRDWSDLLGLMDTYRRIRRIAADTGVSVWE